MSGADAIVNPALLAGAIADHQTNRAYRRKHKKK